MFGRRRRRLAASAALSVASTPVLRDEQIFELLHDKLTALVGEHGAWTLVARSADDTEVIFHGLKAREIATELTDAITTQQAALRGESSGEPTALTWFPAPITTWSEPAASEAPARGAAPINAEPINAALANAASVNTAFADTAFADTAFADTASVDALLAEATSVEPNDDDLAAASAAWIDKASATLASARLVV
ncbi:hypothetical protein [Cryobacterium sp. Hb1]|uniref:hypothetical protein n=1 Tax=Cryobacterium sp. Hb1 TaxID=1259147 RepID=UPI00106AEA60|nr:hypothetical protein [Cryobacterium sp. Hb1]TFD67106.1 hypothetical protein E3T38_12170 [Cryobacterium sp. Hb1]